jgi:hypothetical protein
MEEVFSACISAVQIHEHIYQVRNFNAPRYHYQTQTLRLFFWRDIISVGMSTVTLMISFHLMCLLGCFLPQLIHPSLINGKFYNRYESMKMVRLGRKFMEALGLIESPPRPLVPRSQLLKEMVKGQFHDSKKDDDIIVDENQVEVETSKEDDPAVAADIEAKGEANES